MNNIEKALKKLSGKERERAKEILKNLYAGNTNWFDIKKLKGREDIFRIRKGDIRIIYRLHKNAIFILAIERRNDNTYKL